MCKTVKMANLQQELSELLGELQTLSVDYDGLPESMIESVDGIDYSTFDADSLSSLAALLSQHRGEAVWTAFTETHTSAHSRLLLQLHNCIVDDSGTVLKLNAASVYFALLQSPGAAAFGVFQSFTFRRAVRQLRNCVEDVYSELSKKGADKKDFDASIVQGVHNCVRNLGILLNCGAFSLALAADLLPDVVEAAGAALRLASFPVFAFVASDVEQALISIVHARHGEVTMVSRLVLKRLKDALMDVSSGRKVQSAAVRVTQALLSWTPPPPLPGAASTPELPDGAWSVSVVEGFSPACRSAAGSDVAVPLSVWERLPGAAALLQHLCVGAPERADARAAAADAVAQVFSHMPHNMRRHFVKFLGRLSRHSRPAHRATGVEVITSLLLSSDGMVWRDDAAPTAHQRTIGSHMPKMAADDDDDEDEEEEPPASPAQGITSPSARTVGSARRTSAGSARRAAGGSPFTPFPSLTPHSGRGSLSPGTPLLSAESVEEGGGAPTAVLLLDMLLHRASDKAPTVRAKALSSLCDVLLMDGPVPAAATALDRGNFALVCMNCIMTHKATSSSDGHRSTVGVSSILARDGSFALLPLLIKRLDDDRSHVRRAAINALATAAQLGGQCFASVADAVPVFEGCTLAEMYEAAGKAMQTPPSRCIGAYALQMLATKCDDESVLVRKTALGALTDLLELEPSTPCVQQAWLAGVLPIVMSTEATEAILAAECFTRCVVQPLVSADDAEMGTVWPLLASVRQSSDLAACVSSCLQLGLKVAEGVVKASGCNMSIKKLMKTLQASGSVDSLAPAGAGAAVAASASQAMPTVASFQGSWCLLGALADALVAVGSIVSASTLRAVAPLAQWAWAQARSVMAAPTRDSLPALGDMLRLVASTAAYIPTQEQDEALQKLGSALCNPRTVGALSGDALSAAVHAAAACAFASKSSKDWHAPLQAAVEKALSAAVSGSADDVAVRYLAVVGELALLGVDADADGGKSNAATIAGLSEAARKLACGDRAKLPMVPITEHCQTLVQALVMPAAGAANGSLSASVDATMVTVGTHATALGVNARAEQLRAHAFIALGKLCLRDAAFAKRMTPALVKELVTPDAPVAVRNNVLVILADLCGRYTSIVDRYVPDMAACLKDAHPLVRRQSLMVLTQLLTQDYVKWKGPLFFRYVSCLVDSDEGVRSLAEAALAGPLRTKSPNLIPSKFIDTMFVLTGCQSHPAARDVIAQLQASVGVRVGGGAVASAAWDGLAFPGVGGQRARMAVYAKLLALMTPEQRLTVSSKLVMDILGAVVDGSMPLEKSSAGVATPSAADPTGPMSTSDMCREVLAVLRSKDIRGGSSAAASDAQEAAAMGGATAVAAGLEAAKDRVLTKLSAKHTVQNLVPVLVALRGVLLERRSAIMGDLTRYLRLLMGETGEAIKDALAADPQLMAELEYDVQHMAGGSTAAGGGRRGGSSSRESIGGLGASAPPLFDGPQAAAVSAPGTPGTPMATTPSHALSMSTPATAHAASPGRLDLSNTPTPRLKRRTKTAESNAEVAPGALRGKRRHESPESKASGLAGISVAPVLLPSPSTNAAADDTPSKWRVTPSGKKTRSATAVE